MLNVYEFVIGLKFEFFLRSFLHFLVEVDHEPFKQQVFLLKVSVFGHGFCSIGHDVLLLESGVFYEIDVSA